MRLAKMVAGTRPAPTPATEFHVAPTFLGFLEQLGVHAQPGQAELARVAYDGVEPVDRALAERIFGPIDFANVPVGARDVVAEVCGGRGGKTYVLVALRLVWGMLVRDLSPLAPGQEAAATVVAPSERLRQEAVNYALGACRTLPGVARHLRLPRGTRPEDSVSTFGVYRPDFDRVVTFNAAACTRGGYAVRGYWHTDLALDECAFFRDNTYKVNDEEIFKAGKPRVLPGGQTILSSTPWGEAGLLYETHKQNFGKPETALVAHAPTLVLNDVDYTRKIVQAEEKRDPDNAAREFGARFMKGGTTIFFPPDLIDGIVDKTLSLDTPRLPKPGDRVAAGGDLAFRSDSASAVFTHLSGGKLIAAELFERTPDEGYLKPSVTIRAMRDRMLVHGVGTMMADQHYIETLREVLDEENMVVIDAPATPDDVYVRARQLMREGIVRIPDHPKLIRQLKEVQGKPLPGGRMQIVQPRWAKGGHGDLVSAFVLGLWQLCGQVVAAPPPTPERKAYEERRARYLEEQSRSKWKPPATAGWRPR